MPRHLRILHQLARIIHKLHPRRRRIHNDRRIHPRALNPTRCRRQTRVARDVHRIHPCARDRKRRRMREPRTPIDITIKRHLTPPERIDTHRILVRLHTDRNQQLPKRTRHTRRVHRQRLTQIHRDRHRRRHRTLQRQIHAPHIISCRPRLTQSHIRAMRPRPRLIETLEQPLHPPKVIRRVAILTERHVIRLHRQLRPQRQLHHRIRMRIRRHQLRSGQIHPQTE